MINYAFTEDAPTLIKMSPLANKAGARSYLALCCVL